MGSLNDQSTPIEATTADPQERSSLAGHHSTRAQWVGDWLLTFDPRPGPLPSRRALKPWSAVACDGGWTLWQTEPGEGWRGMPQLTVDHGEWRAWLVGELYDCAQPDRLIGDVLGGRRPAAELNGHFLLLAWNRDTREWHVWANRHATLHAYLGQAGSRLALGTFFPAVATAVGCAELDWEGLATFFAYGYFGGDRTHLDGVRTLAPASHTRLSQDGRLVAEDRYWQWHHDPDTSRSYGDTLAEFAARFEMVMDDLTVSGRIAVPISGGLDSRTTVAALSPGRTADGLWAYSYGYERDSVETAIAGRVAAARGLDFSAFTITPYLFANLHDINAAVEGFEDVTQCRQAAVLHEIDQHADYLIAAHLGDLYLDDMGLLGADGISAGDLLPVAMKKVRKGGSEWLLNHVCRPNLDRDPAAVLRENLAGELDRLGAIAEPDFRIKAYKVDQWCARWTTVALRMFMPGAFPRLPFYDLRMADFFCTVPTEMVSGRRLQIDYLKRYAPDLARITWQATGRDLLDERRPPLSDLASRAVSRGVRTLRGQRMAERNWEVQFAGAQGKRGLAEWLLRPGLLLHEHVDPDHIRNLLEAFEREPFVEKRGYTVSMLLSFSVWLENHYRAIAGSL